MGPGEHGYRRGEQKIKKPLKVLNGSQRRGRGKNSTICVKKGGNGSFQRRQCRDYAGEDSFYRMLRAKHRT